MKANQKAKNLKNKYKKQLGMLQRLPAGKRHNKQPWGRKDTIAAFKHCHAHGDHFLGCFDGKYRANGSNYKDRGPA